MTDAWVAAFFALALLVFFLALLVLGTLRRVTPLLVQAEARLAQGARRGGLPVGAQLPSFQTAESNGRVFTHEDLHGSEAVLLFLGRSCRACEPLIEDLHQGRAGELPARLVLVVSDASEAAELDSTGVAVLVQEDYALARLVRERPRPARVRDRHRRSYRSERCSEQLGGTDGAGRENRGRG